MNNLKDTLISIARTPEEFGAQEYINDPAPETWHPKPGPSWFKGVHRQDFGQFFDFEVKHDGDRAIWIAHSEAAKYWAWDHFHESTDRTDNGMGWILDRKYIGFICRAAEAAKLVDKDTAEQDQDQRRQWDE